LLIHSSQNGDALRFSFNLKPVNDSIALNTEYLGSQPVAICHSQDHVSYAMYHIGRTRWPWLGTDNSHFVTDISGNRMPGYIIGFSPEENIISYNHHVSGMWLGVASQVNQKLELPNFGYGHFLSSKPKS
jgi:hypothetical protein